MARTMKQRLEYIDAARGLAIFAVVYSHICLFCLPGYDSSMIVDFLRSYFLNAFFFISGYMAWKPIEKFENNVLRLCRKSIVHLLIPTMVVGTFYALIYHIPILTFCFNGAKFGYWFTFALFEIFIIYYLVSALSAFLKSPIFRVTTIIIISIVFYCLNKYFTLDSSIYNLFCFDSICYYFLFFGLGIIAHEYKALIRKYLRGGGIDYYGRMLSIESVNHNTLTD